MGQPVERNSGHATARKPVCWEAIDWTPVEDGVRLIQERIFRATRDGNLERVKNLQKMLVRSLGALLVAVRRVTQQNKGRNTPGIDGKIYSKVEAREQLVVELRDVNIMDCDCQPVLRAYIPKPGKDEKRPLGIPTIRDRVLQMVVKLALEPEWEAKFEPNSYGFRPGRRCMDAVVQIKITCGLKKGAETSAWILDADIAKCFDTIDHEALLKKVPVFARTIRRWLKAGIVEFGRFFMTKAGTPQGGVISPLLANIALDGLERLFCIYSSSGKYINPSRRIGICRGVSVVRYADDFVVMAPSKEVLVEYVLPEICEYLAKIGMTLSGAKTRIVHRDEGVDFLGFNLRQFNKERRSHFLIQPSKKALDRHMVHVKTILSRNKQDTQANIINRLNPVLRGWAVYYRYSNARRVFQYISHRVFQMLWQWCCRRHEKEGKGKRWIKQKYFKQIGTRKWVFADQPDHQLFATAYQRASLKDYQKVVLHNSPFDATLREYWEKRHWRHHLDSNE
jgi:RNA-directed DNA polymerase